MVERMPAGEQHVRALLPLHKNLALFQHQRAYLVHALNALLLLNAETPGAREEVEMEAPELHVS
jgi:hypothetical protein